MFEAELEVARNSIMIEKAPDFQWQAFLFQFGMHITFPLLILPYLWYMGKQAAINQVFISSAEQPDFMRTFVRRIWRQNGLVLTVNFIVCFVMPRGPLFSFFWPLVMIIDVSALMYALVVAVKYAFWTAEERAEIYHSSFPESFRKNKSAMILASFTNIKPEFYIAELERVMLLLKLDGMDPSESGFTLSNHGSDRLHQRLLFNLKRQTYDSDQYFKPLVRLMYKRQKGKGRRCDHTRSEAREWCVIDLLRRLQRAHQRASPRGRRQMPR
eukprot:5660700-Prymnesium_polylepis.2